MCPNLFETCCKENEPHLCLLGNAFRPRTAETQEGKWTCWGRQATPLPLPCGDRSRPSEPAEEQEQRPGYSSGRGACPNLITLARLEPTLGIFSLRAPVMGSLAQWTEGVGPREQSRSVAHCSLKYLEDPKKLADTQASCPSQIPTVGLAMGLCRPVHPRCLPVTSLGLTGMAVKHHPIC